ncbi:hypothetical protein Unana1_08343 [Umbelopsis nana]
MSHVSDMPGALLVQRRLLLSDSNSDFASFIDLDLQIVIGESLEAVQLLKDLDVEAQFWAVAAMMLGLQAGNAIGSSSILSDNASQLGYFVLSHVWGESKRWSNQDRFDLPWPIKFSLDNGVDLEEALVLGAAVTGCTMAWIDTLCIEQESDDDKMAHVGNMGTDSDRVSEEDESTTLVSLPGDTEDMRLQSSAYNDMMTYIIQQGDWFDIRGVAIMMRNRAATLAQDKVLAMRALLRADNVVANYSMHEDEILKDIIMEVTDNGDYSWMIWHATRANGEPWACMLPSGSAICEWLPGPIQVRGKPPRFENGKLFMGLCNVARVDNVIAHSAAMARYKILLYFWIPEHWCSYELYHHPEFEEIVRAAVDKEKAENWKQLKSLGIGKEWHSPTILYDFLVQLQQSEAEFGIGKHHARTALEEFQHALVTSWYCFQWSHQE